MARAQQDPRLRASIPVLSYNHRYLLAACTSGQATSAGHVREDERCPESIAANSVEEALAVACAWRSGAAVVRKT